MGPDNRVRRRSVLCGTLVALAALSGCSANTTGAGKGTGQPDAESGQVSATAARLGSIEVRDVLIEDPRGGESYSVGHDARMGLEVVNEGPAADVLESVQTPIADETQIFADQAPPRGTDPSPTPSPGPTPDPTPSPTPVHSLSVPPATGTGPSVVRAYVELRALTTPAREGQTYPITFRFRRAGVLQTTVAVQVPKEP